MRSYITLAGMGWMLSFTGQSVGQVLNFNGPGTSVVPAGLFTPTTDVIQNGGTVQLTGNEAISSYNNSGGTLDGNAVLSASTYDLNNAIINAGLGFGQINTDGVTQLNFATLGNLDVQSGVTTVTATNGGNVEVDQNAQLIVNEDLLSNTGDVNNSGTLTLNGDQVIDQFDSAAGAGFSAIVDGPGSLSADDFDLGNNTIINADLLGGPISTVGSVVLNGTTEGTLDIDGVTRLVGANLSDSVDVQGTLFTDNLGVLSDQAAVDVEGALNLTFDQTIANFSSGGSNASPATLNGPGTLTAGILDIGNNSFINANLGPGVAMTNGTVLLASQIAGDLNVQSGEALLSGDLLGSVTVDNGATVDVAQGSLAATAVIVNNGTVELQGDETVASYTSTGTIEGPGTLTANTYNLNDGSIIDIDLGPGQIITNGTINLIRPSAGTIEVQSGTTSLIAANSSELVLIDNGATLISAFQTINPNATVVNNGTLTLNGNQTISDFTTGGTLNGSGILTSDTFNINDGAQIDIELNGLDIITNGAVTLNQATTGALTVQSGTTNLFSANTGSPVTINNGAALSAVANTIDSTATVNNSGTFNLLGSQTFDSFNGSNGTVSGNGVLTVNDFSAGEIQTNLTGSSTSSLSIDTPSATLGSGSQLTLTGNVASLSILDEFDLFVGDGTVTGTGEQAGFGSFDFSGLGPDVRGIFDIQTGNILITDVGTTASSENTLLLQSALELDPNDPNQFINVDGLSAASQDTVDGLRNSLAADPNATIDSLTSQLSPSVYAGLADYTTFQHLSYTRSIGNATHFFSDQHWELAIGASYQSIDKNAEVGFNDEYELQGGGAYIGIYNNLTDYFKVGVFGAYDTGTISSSLADIDVDGGIVGVTTYLELGEYGVLNLGVSGGFFDFDGTRSTLGANNSISGVSGTTLNFEATYKWFFYDNEVEQLSPFVSVNHIIADIDGFSESGTGQSLNVRDFSKDTTFVTAGLEGSWRPYSDHYGLFGRIAYTLNMTDDDNTVDASFGQGDAFSVASSGLTGDILEFRVGGFYQLAEHTYVDLSYFTLGTDDASSANGVNLGFRVLW